MSADGLAAIASWGLPGAPTSPLASIDVGALDLDDVEAHGLAGLLLAAHEAGAVDLAGATWSRLQDRLDEEAQLSVRLEAELLRLAPVLARHDGVVLKGPAIAHLTGADPAWRPFSDLDLLVAPASIELVLRDLARLGYERPRPDPAPGFATHVAKATAVAHPTGLLVDLHRTITLGAAGELVDVDEVLAHRIELAAGPVRFAAPAWPAHLVVVALHAALGDGLRRPRSLRDVVVVAHHPEQDPAAAVALARRWGVDAAVGAALRAAADQLHAELPEPLRPLLDAAPDTTAPPVELDGARHRVDQLGGARALRSRCTLARSMVAPTPTFLRWAYGDAPLPALYLRRWRDLRERATAAPGAGGAR